MRTPRATNDTQNCRLSDINDLLTVVNDNNKFILHGKLKSMIDWDIYVFIT